MSLSAAEDRYVNRSLFLPSEADVSRFDAQTLLKDANTIKILELIFLGRKIRRDQLLRVAADLISGCEGNASHYQQLR